MPMSEDALPKAQKRMNLICFAQEALIATLKTGPKASVFLLSTVNHV